VKSENKIAGVGLLTAIAASLCCITPVIALVAGSSSLASGFSWMEPARPYLIGFTVLSLGFAWYQQLKPQKEIDCCEPDRKESFMQSKLFLGLVTVFAALMLSFPSYAHFLYGEDNSGVQTETALGNEVLFTIEGMTCSSCEIHVDRTIRELDGIGRIEVSYEKGNALVAFDPDMVDEDEIIEAINSTGYMVIQLGEHGD
jgi:copper chaperone CopZ